MKQIKNNLTEIEKRTQKYFDIAKVILVAIDVEGNINLINKEGCKVLGYSKKEIIGKNWFDNFLPERIRNEVKSVTRKILTGDVKSFASYENPILTKNGSEKLIVWNNTYIKDKSGKIIATLSSGEDITRHRQLEDRSRYLYNVLTAVRNVNQLITREKDIKKLIKKTCKILIETRGFKHAWIVLIDEEGKIIHTVEEGIGKDFMLMVERIKTGKPTYCWKKAISSSAIIIQKDTKNCSGCPLYGKYENTHVVTKRLAYGGKIYGIIAGYVPVEYVEDKEEKRLFSEIAGDLSFALYNLRIEEEKKEADKALKESEGHYRALFNNSLDGIYRTTVDGKYIDANPSLVKILGYSSKEELLAIDIPTQLYVHKDKRLQPYQRNRIFEAQFKKKDGSVITAEINSIVIYKNGKPAYYEGVVRDITEQKILRDKIRESEKKYHAIFENTGTATMILEEDTTISMVNSVFEKLSGYSKSEVGNKKSWTEFVVEEDLKRMKKYHLFRRTKSGRAPRSYESGFVAKSGDIKNIFITVSIIPGTKKSIASMMDITDRKKAENDLKIGYKRLQKTLSDAIDALAYIVELKDPYTAGHQKRVAMIAVAIAEELGLDKDKIKAIDTAALIHDIGKINISASILARPGKISKIEYDMIKTHSQTGYDLIKRIEFPWPIAGIVLQHHERLDGSGYPKGLKGKDICTEAKILAVADVVEAMFSHRPYRPALGIDKAVEEITEGKGKLYDPKVVDACAKLIAEKKFKF